MPDDAAPAFGQLLRRYRTEAALTQADLAERAGISTRAVSDLERGSGREPRLHTVSLLIQALGLTADQQVQLRTAARPSIAASSPAPQRASLPTLPIPATPLLGRDGEMTVLAARLRRGEVRLLTLTGPGRNRPTLTPPLTTKR